MGSTGDCFSNPADATVHGFLTVTAIPCSQPHDAQVYAALQVPGLQSFPGAAPMNALAKSGCNARLGDVNRAILARLRGITWIAPSSGSWNDGHQQISCLVLGRPGSMTTSVLTQ